MSETRESNQNGLTIATQVLPQKPTSDSFIYRQDVVSCSKYKGLLGVVEEVAGDTYSDSDDSTTDDSDHKVDVDKNVENEVIDDVTNNVSDRDNDDDSLPEGHARIAWTDGSKTTDKINDITLVDRTFMHGDMVYSITDPVGQLGQVVDVNITVDLLTGNGETIKGVSSKDLINIKKFSAGDYVVSGPWFGRVEDVFDSVIILFDDRSVCKVVDAHLLKLQPVNKPIIDDESCLYYPGQRIRAVSSSVFKSSKWLSGSWKAHHVEGTVCKVETVSVLVYWIASAYRGAASSPLAPPEQQNPKDLTLIDCISHANWQLCEFCLLPSPCNGAKISRKTVGIKHQTTDISKKDNSSKNVAEKVHIENGMPEKFNQCDPVESWRYHSRKLCEVSLRKDKKYSRKNVTFESALFINKKVTKVDVVWQDGTKECGLDPTFLSPIETTDAHEFFPNQIVFEKSLENDGKPSESKRFGFVKRVNAKEKTVIVRWRIKSVSKQEFESEGVSSAYELGYYGYYFGDVVVRKPMKEESSEIFCDRSWVGNISGLQEGDVVVTWVDGTVSKVCARAIDVYSRDFRSSIISGNEDSDGASWETVDEDDMNTVVNGEQEDEDDLSNPIENGADGDKMAIIENNSQGQSSPLSCLDNHDVNESGSHNNEGISTVDLPNQNAMADSQNESDDDQENDYFFRTGAEDSVSSGAVDCSFKHFDIAENPLDHHYIENKFQSTCGKKWVKKVQQEWSILEKNLPDDIYVRAYEDRMDLLRAVIIGAAGTPYQDGLFFFDFHIPLDYPQVPPATYYHSGGLRINPNLYDDGKVCLSLLNTWKGKGNEVWDPSSSTILQILVSLQALVLNSNPYFNEAGYDKQLGTIEGEKNSLPYNENTYLLNLKSMMYLLRRPPMLFEGLVKDHFQQRGAYILKACEWYMCDCTVGTLAKDASITKKTMEKSSSVGFKLMLTKIIPRLILAFKEASVDCKEFDYLQSLEFLRVDT